MSQTQQVVNRRIELREPVSGQVILVVDAPLAREISGTLVDRSPRGFCASYESTDLQRGDRVRFRHQDASGVAVVVWTRIAGRSVRAGFHVAQGSGSGL